MKRLNIVTVMVMVLALALSPGLSWAATAAASVSATVLSIATITLTRDESSVTRGSATQILFDKRDGGETPPPASPNPAYMYAPYRAGGEAGKNWHVAQIAANGSTLTLSASVTGAVGAIPLANILAVWSGGFFLPGSTTPIDGTADNGWRTLNGWTRTLSQPFIGTVSFNYQLNISQVGSGTYAGTVTFTLTTT